MLTFPEVVQQREQIQDDLMTLLGSGYGLDDRIIAQACQIVVDHFKIMLRKF